MNAFISGNKYSEFLGGLHKRLGNSELNRDVTPKHYNWFLTQITTLKRQKGIPLPTIKKKQNILSCSKIYSTQKNNIAINGEFLMFRRIPQKICLPRLPWLPSLFLLFCGIPTDPKPYKTALNPKP